MEVDEQIKVFRDFIEQNYYPELLEAVRKGNNFLVLDFSLLIKFNTEICEELLETPEELLKAAELAIKDFDLPKKITKFAVRLKNLPESQKVLISEIRSKHLNKIIWMEGIVRQKSDVRPHVTAAKFECPSCGNILNVLQADKKYREPSRCSCGRKGKFKEISKELVDGQGLVLEESPDDLDSSAQPKRINVFLKDDLVSPITERKSSPGSRVRVVGWLAEVPIVLKTGGQSVKYDLIVEANFVEPMQDETFDIIVNEKELDEIKKIAKNPNVLSVLANSLAPSIYGHDKVKEALVLQLAGGCKKERPDGVVTRGDMHVLLIGDPGCIAGESRVSLYHKGMKQIQTMGTTHLQPLRELVSVIRKNQSELPYDYTANFQVYKQYPTLQVTTETGKSIICTYNHPLLTTKGWMRTDMLKEGMEIRVMPKIPCVINSYRETYFKRVKRMSGKLKEDIILPAKYTAELGALCGYVIGDGSVHSRGYTITCYINEEEKDLIGQLQRMWKRVFSVESIVHTTTPKNTLEMNSREVTQNLLFLEKKRVPDFVFESPLDVVSSFLRWLFEADGCCFSTGRGKTSVQLKAKNRELLADVQLLLLYFGIQGRIIEDNLCIRRSYDITIFARKIGFASQKKQKRLREVVRSLDEKSEQQKRKTPQRYEKIVSIVEAGIRDVYDFEVPKTQMFIANGIVSHNSGKSQLLKRMTKIAPKARFTSGKGATAAGLTASVVKDEFLGGWSLEAGTLVLANQGFAIIDEMDKMGKEDRSALHEALEQQSYHHDTEIMFADGSTQKIGEFVEQLLQEHKNNKVEANECEILFLEQRKNPRYKIISTDFSSLCVSPIDRVSRHKAPTHFYKITYSNGRFIVVTPEHPIYVVSEDANIITLEARAVEKGMLAPAPKLLPIISTQVKEKDEVWGMYLGLQCSEGYTYKNEMHRYAEIGISNTNPMINVLARKIMSKIFDKEPFIHTRKVSQNIKATKELITTKISSQKAYQMLVEKTPELLVKAPFKRVPQEVKAGSMVLKQNFLGGFFLGDGFVDQERAGFSTSSRYLAEDLQQLCLEQEIYTYIETEHRKIQQLQEKNYYKVIVSGAESYVHFKNIVHKNDPRKKKIENLYIRSTQKKNDRDVLPHSYVKVLHGLLKEFRLDNGYFHQHIKKNQHAHRQTCWNYLQKVEQKFQNGIDVLAEDSIYSIRKTWNLPLKKIAMNLGKSVSLICYYEQKSNEEYIRKVRQMAELKKQEVFVKIQKLHRQLAGQCRFVKISSVEKIENKDQQWTYDVTIEPNHTFVSQNLILHNTVSIAKANIQATLRCETTVLAAANPKFGRFDPYGIIAEQIDLPPTLINRFDLIFPIKDLPNREKDEMMATFILSLHQNPEKAQSEIPTELLKKYFVYVRQKIQPKMTDQAVEELKEYYISMRNSGANAEGGIKSIPITARQLEGLVRLSEAAAKIRLSKTVTKKDAQKAIEMIDYCLNQIAKDKDTGQIDIDRLSSRITATQRSSIGIIKDIIHTLEEQTGQKIIPVEQVLQAAQEKNINQETAEDILEKLRRSGDVFEPKKGFIQKL